MLRAWGGLSHTPALEIKNEVLVQARSIIFLFEKVCVLPGKGIISSRGGLGHVVQWRQLEKDILVESCIIVASVGQKEGVEQSANRWWAISSSVPCSRHQAWLPSYRVTQAAQC